MDHDTIILKRLTPALAYEVLAQVIKRIDVNFHPIQLRGTFATGASLRIGLALLAPSQA